MLNGRYLEKIVRAFVAILVSFLSIAGCGGGDGADDESPVTLRTGQPGRPVSATIGVPYEQFRQLSMAEDKLIQQCMAKAGFKYTVAIPPEQEEKEPWMRGDDVAKAHKDGYGIWQHRRETANELDPRAPRPDPDTDGLSKSEKERFERTLDGTRRVDFNVVGGGVMNIAVDGCLAEAQKELYGDIKQWSGVESLATNFKTVALTASSKYPEYKQAEKKWSACMSKSGYRYPTPDEAYDEAYTFYSGIKLPSAPLKKEIELAVADATCDKKLGVSALKVKLYDRALKESIEQFEPQIIEYNEKQRKALKIAQGILK